MRRLALPAVAGLLAVVLPWTAYAEEGGATIAHTQSTDHRLTVLVDVPEGAQVDLAGVQATLDGKELDVEAAPAADEAAVTRTSVLAIDTSLSMDADGRFEAAQEAARAYLAAVPADVRVGIVAFDGTVEVALPPTLDRAAARRVVDGLTLDEDTLLYDAVVRSVALAGTSGQRSVLVLSDGADTGGTATLQQAVAAAGRSGARVDVVALGQDQALMGVLGQLARAGKGQAITADGETLSGLFADEASDLARQVLVRAPLPAGFTASEATLEVTLPSTAGELGAKAFIAIESEGPAAATPALEVPRSDGPWGAPAWMLPVAVAVLGAGLFGLAFALVPARPRPMTITERVAAYVDHTTAAPAADKPARTTEPVLHQAKAAAADLLHRNRGLESRVEQRLAAAGSGFKPAEWLLLHVGVTIASALLGLLLGGLLVAVLLTLVGVAVPPVWLRWQEGRRRRAFDSALPDVLQLMAGALAAGLSLPQSVDTVAKEGPDPVAREFQRVLVENRVGLSVEDAFEALADRYQSQDFAWVVMAIRIQREVGGNLAELLLTVAETMREREYLRRQVQTLAAEGKLSAIILCAMPPAFLVFIAVAEPSMLDPLFETLIGWAVLGGATLWLAVGVFWMSRLIKVEV